MRARRLAPVLCLAAALAACDAGTTTPTKSSGGRGASAKDGATWTVTHVLIATSDSPAPQHRGKITRSRAVGKQIARSLIAELQAGRAMEELVKEFSNDVDDGGKAQTNNGKPGSYTFGPGEMVPAFEATAKATPVGKVAPEPVETPFGYHVIRRDK